MLLMIAVMIIWTSDCVSYDGGYSVSRLLAMYMLLLILKYVCIMNMILLYLQYMYINMCTGIYDSYHTS